MTLFWYDLETFGRDSQMDRIAQFAGLRTNENFEPLEDPVMIYCRISPDYVPDPGACMITGITPQETLEKGVSEYEFIQRIDQEFSRPGTCVVGYNSIKFDDEFIRNCYYRNFFDPYRREWAGGNSRWDIIDLVRAAHDLRPEGIEWPKNEDGRPIFKLEELSKANGIEHRNAHDALSDVYATIGLAKLIFDKQPKLFRYVFNHRKKDQIKPLVNLHTREPFLLTSRVFSSMRGATSVVAPLAVDPGNNNSILCWDLRHDPEPLLSMPVEQLKYFLFLPRNQRKESDPFVALTAMQVNKCPVISPMSIIDQNLEERLGFNMEQIRSNWKRLKGEKLLTQKVRSVFSGEFPPDPKDPDLQIYSGGFFKDSDQEQFRIIHRTAQSEPKKLTSLPLSFDDPRLPEMLRRFVGRNFPDKLSPEASKRWKSFCASRVLFPPVDNVLDFGEFEKKLAKLKDSAELAPEQKVIVKKLDEYAIFLKETVLHYKE